MVLSVYSLTVIPLRYVVLGSIASGLAVVVVLFVLWGTRTPRAAHPRTSRSARPNRFSRRQIAGLIAAIVLSVLFAGIWSASRQVTGLLDSFPTSDGGQTTQAAPEKPFIVYISGLDTSGDISTQARSDVNILAVVDPDSKKLLLVNTPRDYYVQLHGTDGLPDKLTHAGLYGVEMSRATLEDLYGVPIDYTLRVNFDSLIKLVDMLGGISVWSDVAFRSDNYSFRAGMNTLDSAQALEFSRTRYAFSDGDRQRGKNQQRVIEAIVSKLSRPESISKLPQLLPALSGSFETTVPRSYVAELVREQINDSSSWNTTSISVDGTGDMRPTYSMGAQPLSVIVPDEQSVAHAKATIRAALSEE
jgi:LCP family protein required for cell wall assembly